VAAKKTLSEEMRSFNDRVLLKSTPISFARSSSAWLRAKSFPTMSPPIQRKPTAASTPSGVPPTPINTSAGLSSIAVIKAPATSPSGIRRIRAPAARTSRIRSVWRGRSRMTTVRSSTLTPLHLAILNRFSLTGASISTQFLAAGPTAILFM